MRSLAVPEGMPNPSAEMARAFATTDVLLRLSTTTLTIDGARLRPTLAREAWIPNVEPVLKTVLQRDFATCRACGFRSATYQELTCVGANARDLDALVTLCTFCAQCFRLDCVDKMRSGKLAYLPHISQAELHWIVRELFVARGFPKVARRAAVALETLTARCAKVGDLLGTESPSELARMIEKAAQTGTQAELDQLVAGVRLLPLDSLVKQVPDRDLEYNMFPQLLAYWSSRHGPLAYVASADSLRWLPLLEARLSA